MTTTSRSPLARFANSVRKHGVLGSLRSLAVFAFAALLVGLSRPTLMSVLVGLPFVALGLLFRVWAAGHLVKTKELATGGPYRHVQHPLYFGRLALGTGLCLMAWREVDVGGLALPVNLVLLAVFWIVFFAYYIPRKKRVEGARLLKVHGDAWAQWAATVPLVLPSVRPIGAPSGAWSRERFGALGEGGVVIVVVALVVFLVVRALG